MTGYILSRPDVMQSSDISRIGWVISHQGLGRQFYVKINWCEAYYNVNSIYNVLNPSVTSNQSKYAEKRQNNEISAK